MSVAPSPVADSSAVLRAVKDCWGYDVLRPLQHDAIEATLRGRDSLVVMPTGGGKSLCYQVPPLVTGRLTLVVSPLIALMRDQVDGLRVAGYPAAALHSNLSAREGEEMRRDIENGRLRLLLVAPERLFSEGFVHWLKRPRGEGSRVGAIAIDEAHCISQWGHDFRPEYRRLAELRQHFPEIPFNAFTATATPRVREDIIAQLKLREPTVVVGRFDRPNLTYRILPRVNVVEQTAQAIRRHAGAGGELRAAIVYCITRNETEQLAGALAAQGIHARAYHAGLNAGERTEISSDFRSEKLPVVAATVAFGMGIDRGDVRCVVHAGMPKSIEHYQQETGRAGRDGLPAECLLLYSAADATRWKKVMAKGAEEKMSSAEALERQYELLEQMQRFAAAARCRHRALSEYFGQEYAPPAPGTSHSGNGGDGPDGGDEAGTSAHSGGGTSPPLSTLPLPVVAGCSACDFCLDELDVVPDSLVIAQKILSCVARVGQAFGAAHVADVLRGSRAQKIIDRRHDQLSTFGLLKEVSKDSLINYMNQLIDHGVLARTLSEFPVLTLTPSSVEVFKGQRDVVLRQPRRIASDRELRAVGAAQGESLAPLTPEEDRLFESLRVLRRGIAESMGVPPYAVFDDATLEEISRVRPGSAETFICIRGVGQVKLARFGERFISHVRDFCGGSGMTLDAAAGSRPRTVCAGESAGITASRFAAEQRFQRGESVEEVSRGIGRARSTTLSYLVEYIHRHKPASVGAWISEDRYELIADAAKLVGVRPLKAIYDFLGGKVEYEDLRIVVNHMEATGRLPRSA